MASNPDLAAAVFTGSEDDLWWRALAGAWIGVTAPDPLEQLVAAACGPSTSVWTPQPALDAAALEMEWLQLVLVGQPAPDAGWAAFA